MSEDTDPNRSNKLSTTKNANLGEARDAEVSCKACLTLIASGATVCPFCQRHQSWWMRHLPSAGILASLVGLLATFGMLIVAFMEYDQASKQNDLAKQERTEAAAALKAANSAMARSEQIEKDLNAVSAGLKQEPSQMGQAAESRAMTIEKQLNDAAQSATIRAQEIKERLEAETERLQNEILLTAKIAAEKAAQIETSAKEALTQQHIQSRNSLIESEVSYLEAKLKDLKRKSESFSRQKIEMLRDESSWTKLPFLESQRYENRNEIEDVEQEIEALKAEQDALQ